ncbi:MAG: hypothetical protein HYX75_16230 [Acidobacteria bacterium]|nr:hypothetical protein [Acidobacteriota bacterium]
MTANDDLYLLDRERGRVWRVEVTTGKMARVDVGSEAVPMAIAAPANGGLFVLVRIDGSYACRRLDRAGTLIDEWGLAAQLTDPVAIATHTGVTAFVADGRGHSLLEVDSEKCHRWAARATYAEARLFAGTLDDGRRTAFLDGGLLHYPLSVATNENSTLLVDRDTILFGIGPWLGICPQSLPSTYRQAALCGLAGFLLGDDETLLMVSLTSFETSLYRLPAETRSLAILANGRLAVICGSDVVIVHAPSEADVLRNIPVGSVSDLALGRRGVRYIGSAGRVLSVSPGGEVSWERSLPPPDALAETVSPTSLCFWAAPDDAEGDRLFVCGNGRPEIEVLSPTGDRVGVVPSWLARPSGIAVLDAREAAGRCDARGARYLLCVADQSSDQVVILDPDGVPIVSLGRELFKGLGHSIQRPTRLRASGGRLSVMKATGDIVAVDLSKKPVDGIEPVPPFSVSIASVREAIVGRLLADPLDAATNNLVVDFIASEIRHGEAEHGIELLSLALTCGAPAETVSRVVERLALSSIEGIGPVLAEMEKAHRVESRVLTPACPVGGRLAFARDGSIWVTGHTAGSVSHLTAAGEEISRWDDLGCPIGITIERGGSGALICDWGGRRICRLGADGSFGVLLRRPGDALFVLAASAEHAYVVDFAHRTILTFDGNWQLIGSMTGAAGEQFVQPSDLAIDAHGNLVVVEREVRRRVQVLTTAGDRVAVLPTPPGLRREDFSPECVCVGDDSSVYVADGGSKCVWWYRPDRGLHMAIGRGWHWAPGGMAAREGKLLVSDCSDLGRIVEFTLPAASPAAVSHSTV